MSLAGGTGSRKITGQEIMNASKLSVNNTPVINGTAGRIFFQGSTNVLQQSSSLFWDSTNNRLGIGTSTPTTIVHINGNAAGSEPSLQIRQQANTTPTWFAVRNTDNLAATGAVSLDLGISGGTGQFFAGTTQGDIILKAYSNPFTSKFFLGTGNTAQMVLFPSTNNIGINTTTDAGFRLDVNGTARTSTLTVNNGFILNSGGASPNSHNLTMTSSSATASTLLFRGVNTNSTLTFSLWNAQIIDNNSTGETRFFIGGGSCFPTFYSNGVERMRLTSGGNLLINTTTDAGFRLDVNGTARVTSVTAGVGLVSTWSVSASYARFGHNLFNGGTTFGFLQQQNGDCFINGLSNFISASTNNIFETNGAERMRITSSGNVLIGTTTDAGFKLDVNGTARVSDNLLLTNGIIATSSATTRLQGALNYFTHNRIASSGIHGFQISNYGSTTSFWRYDAGTGDIEFGNSTAYGVTFFANNLARTKMWSSGQWTMGSATAYNASALVAMESTTTGFLPPRMTQTQRNAIASPAIGLEIYQTDATEGKYIYKSSGWTYIG
jgi:hypothetical protein